MANSVGPPSFFSFPDELLFEATLDGFITNSPSFFSVSAACQLRLVCKELEQKVNRCWGTFVTKLGREQLLMDSKEWEAADKGYDLLQKRFPSMKRWENADPVKHEETTDGFVTQALTLFSARYRISIVQLPQEQQLLQIDLASGKSLILPLKNCIPGFFGLTSSIAMSDENIAISCFVDNGHATEEIVIIERASRKEVHKIGRSERIRQMVWGRQFLYVLSIDTTHAKLLRFDSHRWDTPAQELLLPTRGVTTFSLDGEQLLFCASSARGNNEGSCQFFAMHRDTGFSDLKTPFIYSEKLRGSPIADGNGKLYFFSNRKETPSQKCIHSVSVMKGSICVDFIVQVQVGELKSMLVQHDRLFVLDKSYPFSITCFDLRGGKQLREWSAESEGCSGTHFNSLLLATRVDQIKVFTNVCIVQRGGGFRLGTHSITLNF